MRKWNLNFKVIVSRFAIVKILCFPSILRPQLYCCILGRYSIAWEKEGKIWHDYYAWSDEIRSFIVLSILRARSHPGSDFTLLALHLKTTLLVHEIVLQLMVVAFLHVHEILVLHLRCLLRRGGRLLGCPRIPCFSVMHSLGDICALGMLLIEIVVFSTAMRITMRRMLELTDYILLISSCMARTHLILLWIKHVLAILIVHIVTWELVLVCVPLHHIVLVHIDWSHGLTALIKNHALVLLVDGLGVV